MQGYAVLTCSFHKEGRTWVGVCNELGTSAYAPRLEQARDQLLEAILLHLDAIWTLLPIKVQRDRSSYELRSPAYLVKLSDVRDAVEYCCIFLVYQSKTDSFHI